MVKLPYGESDFYKVITEGFFYQDRTMYLKELEKAPSFVYFLRPRRFGKSLFVSMMRHYYDLEYKSEFDKLFGNLAIGKKPTPLANQYMVLYFQFSGIMTNTFENTEVGFLNCVRTGVAVFLKRYEHIFPPSIHKEIIEQKQPNLILVALFRQYELLSEANNIPKIYLMIDEYDHFANNLLAYNFLFFEKAVTQNGFVRTFYELLKAATHDKIINRLFMTGVSPLTLDSLTSGFNIGSNISTSANFQKMAGFEAKEVENLFRKIGIRKKDFAKIGQDLQDWYDGYLFTPHATTHIYNPDMVLYFAVHYQMTGNYPDEMLDANIATDYGKIRNILKIQGKEEQNLAILGDLVQKGTVIARLTTQFSLERPFQTDDFISLLFYMGFLTIVEKEVGGYVFKMPNYVIERLYSEYFLAMVRENNGLPIDNSYLNTALREVAKKGNPQLLYDEIIKIIKALSSRDAQGFTENTLKAIFVSLLQQQNFYYVHSEYESERKYVDVFLETIPGNAVKYELAFELKYIKKTDYLDEQTELDKAEIQLRNYIMSKKFNQRHNLKAFVVVVHGTILHTREIII